ncbi:RAxF-45 family protein [Paenibacillus yonginensis]
MILSGIFYRGSLNGISLPFFNNLMYRQNCEMPLLP